MLQSGHFLDCCLTIEDNLNLMQRFHIQSPIYPAQVTRHVHDERLCANAWQSFLSVLSTCPILGIMGSLCVRGWSILLAWHYNRSSSWTCKGFDCLLGRWVCSNGASDGHEESWDCTLTLSPPQVKKPSATDPKVAPDPSMYCPSVLITPFGPAPYLMILTEPSQR